MCVSKTPLDGIQKEASYEGGTERGEQMLSTNHQGVKFPGRSMLLG